NYEMADALNAAGVPYAFVPFDAPYGNTGCDGGHGIPCLQYAFKRASPALRAALADPVNGVPNAAEQGDAPWIAPTEGLGGTELRDLIARLTAMKQPTAIDLGPFGVIYIPVATPVVAAIDQTLGFLQQAYAADGCP